ncbi:MFS transporter [Bacillus timonensis]|nr:MFS transporter [Bacillus timonensis]
MEYTKTSSYNKLKQKNQQTSSKKWAVVSIASIPLVMTLGNSMLIPVLPTFEKKLKISAFQSSMLITLYSIVAIILIPIAGYLSDRIGRKKVIIPSLVIAALGGLLSGWAAWKMENPYYVILVGRTLQGIGAAGAAPIVLPLVGDMFRDEKEVSSSLGAIETSNTFGKVLSPILGAFLAGILWFLPFLAFPVFCLISILLMLFLVKSPTLGEKPLPFHEFIKAVKKLLKEKGRWIYAIFFVGCVLMFILFGVLFFLSSMLEEKYQIKGIKKGLILAIPLGALCISSFFTGKVIKKNKLLMKWMIFIGVAFLALSTFSIIFSHNIWVLLCIFVVSGIGIGIALPCLDALLTEGVEKEERGTITSIYSSMRFIGVALGPPIFAILMDKAQHSLFIGAAILCLLGGIVVLFSIKPKKEA